MEVGSLWQILMSFPSLTNINYIQIKFKFTVMKEWIVFFIQIMCLRKGQIKKHFLIKVHQIDKEKDGSGPPMDLFFFLRIKQNVSVWQDKQNFSQIASNFKTCSEKLNTCREWCRNLYVGQSYLSLLTLLATPMLEGDSSVFMFVYFIQQLSFCYP